MRENERGKSSAKFREVLFLGESARALARVGILIKTYAVQKRAVCISIS